MTQDEALAAKRVASLESNIKALKTNINTIDKCIDIGKRIGLSDVDLKPWIEKQREFQQTKLTFEGEIANIYNTCEHDFTCVGTVKTIFGDEDVYQCKKCGYQTIDKDKYENE